MRVKCLLVGSVYIEWDSCIHESVNAFIVILLRLS